MESKEEELKEEINKRKQIHREHFEKCKKCKPDDYCNMEMILHHRLLKLEAELKGIQEGKAEAQIKFDKFIEKLKEETLTEIFNEWEVGDDVVEYVFVEIDKLVEKLK